jgi:hypothetical protein
VGKVKAKAIDKIGQKMLRNWMHDFLEESVSKHLGELFFLFGPKPCLAKMALQFVPEGYTNLFSPDSYICIGGGLKGAKLPPNHRQVIAEFTGVRIENIIDGYGMTEKNPMPINHKGKWIIPPWEVPILLDEYTGEMIEMDPNGGKYTGQYAFFDPTASSYWGGIITGDRVTIDWDGVPGGDYVGPVIGIAGRITDLEGPDADKLSCSATFEDYFSEDASDEY